MFSHLCGNVSRQLKHAQLNAGAASAVKMFTVEIVIQTVSERRYRNQLPLRTRRVASIARVLSSCWTVAFLPETASPPENNTSIRATNQRALYLVSSVL